MTAGLVRRGDTETLTQREEGHMTAETEIDCCNHKPRDTRDCQEPPGATKS